MRRLVLVAVLAASPAHAAPMTVTGTVVDAKGHWTADGSRIVTDATIQTGTGMVVVNQLGGTADGFGMISFPGPPVLVPGMTVAVAAHEDADLAGRMHVVLDDVKILGAAPSFVRTGPTKAGHSLYWESGCVFVTVDADGTKEIPGDQEFAVVDASIDTWNTDTASCSYLKVMDEGRKAMEVNGKDYTNLIKFRDVSWCRPATKDDPAKCYSESSAGITTATYLDDGSTRDGAIVDADVEINGVNFAISVGGQTLATMKTCNAELQNTLTHELGHLHGLEHTCLATGDPPRVDNTGAAVPSCSGSGANDPRITEATMYNFQDCDETKKETLEPDDINAICTIYPTAKDPGTCEPVHVGGCCSADGGVAGPVTLSVVVGLVGRRRRKNRRPA
jgi:MYXO-CTERM domain-containing protein